MEIQYLLSSQKIIFSVYKYNKTMSGPVVNTIYNQFLSLVEKNSKCACFTFDKCAFDYQIRQENRHTLMDVKFEGKSECCRIKQIYTTIDISDVCFDYLTNCKWIEYLTRLALEYIESICPPEFVLEEEGPLGCRSQPICYSPPATTITTYRYLEPVAPSIPEPEIIIQKCCVECVPTCERVVNPIRQKIIYQNASAAPWTCGDFSVLKKQGHKGHGFGSCNGATDYNSHQWSKPCHCSTGGCGSSSQLSAHVH